MLELGLSNGQVHTSMLSAEIGVLKCVITELKNVSAVDEFAQRWLKGVYEDLGWPSYENSSRLREIFKTPLTNLYKQLFQPTSSSSILEIGAGQLNEQQHSYLSQLFPHLTSWTFSDVVQKAEHYQLSTSKRCIALDLTQPCLESLIGSFDYIVGNNVLDTIPYADLEKAIKTIGQLLKPGRGQFIHFADLNLYSDAFIDACMKFDENNVFLPSQNIKASYILCVSKSEYERILQEQKDSLSDEEYRFFIEWGQQGPALQAMSIHEIILNKFSVIQIAQRIRFLFKPVLQKVKRNQLFEEYLKKAIHENNLEIHSCTNEAATYKREKNCGEDYNVLRLQNGYGYTLQDDKLSSKEVSVTATIHVCTIGHLKA